MAAAQDEDPRAVPLIAALLDIPTGGYPSLDYSPQKQKEETIRALSRQLIALSRETPLLLSLEDAHWIDPSSLEAFDHLVQLVRAERILALITFRPEFSPRWAGQSHVTLLTLNRLGARQTAELVGRVAGAKPLPDEVLQQIAAKTDGVPLFVEELTKSVLESGLLKEEAERYSAAAPLPALAIPATLRDSLMARLDRLAPVKAVAQVGACIGREFDYRLLCFAATAPEPELIKALARLADSGMVFQRGSPPDASYVFKHALVQDAAYESLLKARRIQIHARIAAALEQHFPATVAAQPEVLAQHYTAAEIHEKAFRYWLQAGELARRRMALQESIAHLKRGVGLLAQLEPGADRDRLELEVRAALGTAWMALRGWAYAEVERNLARAWELERELGDAPQPLRSLWGLWVHRLCSGRERESLALGEELLDRAEKTANATMRLAGLWATCLSRYFLGQFAEAVVDADGVLRGYDPVRERSLLDWLNHDAKSTALTYKACAQWMLGYPDNAATLAEEALAWSRSRRHAFDLGWVLHFVPIFVFHQRREPERCAPLLDEFERLAREQRFLFFEEVLVPLWRALMLLQLNRPREAEPAFRVAIPRWSEAGMGSSIPFWKIWHAQSAGLLNQLDQGLTLVEEALEQIRRPGWEEQIALSEALRIKGWLLERRGDLMQAENCFRDALRVAREQRAKSWELRAATSYARLLKDRDQGAQATGLLQPVYDWFTEGHTTRDHIEARQLLDELRA